MSSTLIKSVCTPGRTKCVKKWPAVIKHNRYFNSTTFGEKAKYTERRLVFQLLLVF